LEGLPRSRTAARRAYARYQAPSGSRTGRRRNSMPLGPMAQSETFSGRSVDTRLI
jgi:hypothetical protein